MPAPDLTLALIEEVGKHPEIYSPELGRIKSLTRVDAWQKVCDTLNAHGFNVTPLEVKTKWRTVKDIYRRAKKIAAADNSEPKWRYFKQCDPLLRHTVQTDQTCTAPEGGQDSSLLSLLETSWFNKQVKDDEQGSSWEADNMNEDRKSSVSPSSVSIDAPGTCDASITFEEVPFAPCSNSKRKRKAEEKPEFLVSERVPTPPQPNAKPDMFDNFSNMVADLLREAKSRGKDPVPLMSKISALVFDHINR